MTWSSGMGLSKLLPHSLRGADIVGRGVVDAWLAFSLGVLQPWSLAISVYQPVYDRQVTRVHLACPMGFDGSVT